MLYGLNENINLLITTELLLAPP